MKKYKIEIKYYEDIKKYQLRYDNCISGNFTRTELLKEIKRILKERK